MHQYNRPILPNWHPAWMLAPVAVWAILLMLAFCPVATHHEPGVRHALPDPYVPQCYATEWRSGQYCEFRPVKRIGNN